MDSPMPLVYFAAGFLCAVLVILVADLVASRSQRRAAWQAVDDAVRQREALDAERARYDTLVDELQ